MRYNLKGVISSDEDAPIYRFFGMAAVSPADIRQAIADNPAGEDFVLDTETLAVTTVVNTEQEALMASAIG